MNCATHRGKLGPDLQKSHLHGALWGRGTFWWPQTFTSRGTVGLCLTSYHGTHPKTRCNPTWIGSSPAQWNWTKIHSTFQNVFVPWICAYVYVGRESVCIVYVYIYICIMHITLSILRSHKHMHAYWYFRSVCTLWSRRFKIYVILSQSTSLSSPGIFHMASCKLDVFWWELIDPLQVYRTIP